MESIAYEYFNYMNIIKMAIPDFPINRIIGVGGGAKSQLFNQIKADVLQCAYQPMERKDSATLACAVIAGYGTGIYESIPDTITKFVSEGKVVMPNHYKSQVYSELVQNYFNVINELKRMYTRENSK